MFKAPSQSCGGAFFIKKNLALLFFMCNFRSYFKLHKKNMKIIKAIETSYNGYKFRSRLEARWAVYFDALDIEYLYEPEGIKLSDGSPYLPDFYLPQFKTFVEVKGLVLDTFDYHRARLLVKDTEIPIILLDHQPDFRFYQMIAPKIDQDDLEILNINMVRSPKKPNKFLRNRFLGDRKMFEENKLNKEIDAVLASRGERFNT